MTEEAQATQKTKSNAANGTKQIWVKGAIHRALARTAEDEKRTIRIVVETRLLESYGVDTIEELEEKFNLST